jgi:hypothetical protein
MCLALDMLFKLLCNHTQFCSLELFFAWCYNQSACTHTLVSDFGLQALLCPINTLGDVCTR